MKPELLNYIDDVINERLTLLHERESDPTWINESEDLKSSTEEEIKKCDEILNEIKKELFHKYCFSLKSNTIGMNKKYKDKEEFKKDYLNGEYFYDKDSYENGHYISKKEIELEKIRLLYIYENVLGNLIFDTKKLKFISINDI